MSEPDRPQSGSRTWTVARYRALLRARGPRSVRFRTRLAILMGAVAIGLAATLFALAADAAAEQFTDYAKRYPYAPLVTTPLIFAALVWMTRRYVPLARGSGIPQVIAAQANPEQATRSLVSIRTVLGKALLTLAAVMGGASVGARGRPSRSPPP